jgi:hypothetical protein
MKTSRVRLPKGLQEQVSAAVQFVGWSHLICSEEKRRRQAAPTMISWSQGIDYVNAKIIKYIVTINSL